MLPALNLSPHAHGARRPSPAQPVRIALAQDRAFGFYYPDDLQALRDAGAELLPFDTLSDPALPDAIDGLFIGGRLPRAVHA